MLHIVHARPCQGPKKAIVRPVNNGLAHKRAPVGLPGLLFSLDAHRTRTERGTGLGVVREPVSWIGRARVKVEMPPPERIDFRMLT